jgi:hypothetical protein
MIAVAGGGEFPDRISHCREFGNLCLDLGDVRQSKPLYIRAGAPLVLPEINELPGPLDRETQVARA